MEDYFSPAMTPRDAAAVSALGLAHVGDGVFELLNRTWLCRHGITTAKHLHRATVERVSAPAQAEVLDRLLPVLTQDEQAVYRRGRNAHVNAVPKNADREQYAKATGLEALFGWLYLTGQKERVCALFALTVEEDSDAS